MSERFNLEAAIQSWRRFTLAKQSISDDDADELESHLRDEIDARTAEDVPLQKAFEDAVRRMGDPEALEAAYDQVFWTKLRDHGGALDEIRRRAALAENYLKIAVRTLRRGLGYTMINVTGLAIGLACCLLILHFVQHEGSFDRHHEQVDRIFRVTTHYPADGRDWATTSPPVGPALKEALPEIEQVARFLPFSSNAVLQHGERRFDHSGGVYADSTAFEIFTLPLVRGHAEHALSAPYSVVLTQRLARRIFGDEDPIGKTLGATYFDGLTVTGVVADLPTATHLPFEFMVSMETFYDREPEWATVWNWERAYTYVLLRQGAAPEAVRRKIPSFVESSFTGGAGRPDASALTLDLQPLGSIYLYSNLEREYGPTRDVRTLYLFGGVAVLVLLIACVNFVNLSTARSMQRSREVGVRKVLGADRKRLIGQFLGESLLLSAFALVLAGVIIVGALPLFNRLAGTSFTLEMLITPGHAAAFFGVGILAGLASGFYPALILSGFRPTQALYEKRLLSSGPTRLRDGLVVFQFAVSVFLLIATAVLFRQFAYIQDKSLGFDRDRVVAVRLNPGDYREVIHANPETVKQELKRHPAIEEVSLASSYPGECCNVEPVQVGRGGEPVNLRVGWAVDHDYLSALGISVGSGRDFSMQAPSDSAGWLLNRAAARQLGVADPIGRTLTWRAYTGPVVGIVENFHYASLHHEVEPLALPLRPAAGHLLLIRMQPQQSRAVLDHVGEQLRRLGDDEPLRYAFLSDEFRSQYASEDQLRDVLSVFAILAVVIACLGLYGLAAFTTQRRTKEIGIRKVLGAHVSEIALLLAADYVKLVAIAFLVAAPLAYLAASRWLEIFAYRMELSIVIFVAAGAAAVALAVLTVSHQAVRAALADPVDALRYE